MARPLGERARDCFCLYPPLVQPRAKAVGKVGVAIHRMRVLFPYRFTGHRFHQNVAVVVPKDERHLEAIWSFCCSPDYARPFVAWTKS